MKALPVALPAALLALGALSVSAPAHADYCRTKSCDDQPAYDDVWQEGPDAECNRDGVGCLLEGQPLYWPQSCISFSVQRDGSAKQSIDFDTAHAIISASFDAWLNADCGDGATPGFAIADFSPANCGKAEYNQDQGNANVFTFRDGDWPYEHSLDTLALTTITYNTENAQIYDADVEINSAEAHFTTTDVQEEILDDLQSILTHECGHFLGLSHDSVYGSTMFPNYGSGQFHQRTLDADDTAGICEIFPPGDIDSDHCAPRHGFSRDCSKKDEGGCGVSRQPGNAGGSAGALLLLGLGLVARRLPRRIRAKR